MKTKTKATLIIAGAVVVALSIGASPVFAGGSSQSVVYNNIPSPTPSNVPSIGFEATSTSEFGGQVGLDGTQRKDPKITVLMSSWACKSGSWNGKNCITNPGSTFTHPITLNVYNVNPDESPGALIKSETQTFTMPYRPTADDGTNCNGANAGKWWDGAACVNGKAFKISFNLNGVTLPDDVIVGVAYNTSDYGTNPLGTATACHSTPQGCPYDSLNVGTNPTPTVGDAQPTENDAYANSSWSGFYCDAPVPPDDPNYPSPPQGPVGVFRLDAGCWTGYLPAFKIEASGKGQHNGGHHHHNNGNHYGDKNHHNEYKEQRGFYNLLDD